nr:LEAF RUST 10 DISEASE-RESISTANCE LOCUS RECEPTOR-LIKE PROTEIN KINASE-like 1.5 [Ipomoea batatas]
MPPPHSAATLSLIFLIAALAHGCSPPSSAVNATSCPPFTAAPPPYPFSASPGCGHPSFQIHCSSPRPALISINNLSFSLRHYDPASASLLLSPIYPSRKTCSSGSVPGRPISLSGSPFRVSDSACARLSGLRPCRAVSLPNCSYCPWECKLTKNPARLLRECGSTRPDSQQGCHDDILGFLDGFLKMGVEVEWDQDEDRDPYFSGCKSCRAKNGVCGFNSSHPLKPFLCFPSLSLSPPLIKETSPNRIAMLSLVFLFMCFLIVFSVGAVIFRARNKALDSSSEDPTVVYLRRHRSATHLPPEFTYEELESSTNRFDPKRKIGDGGFGSVYLGQLHDGRIVAVKHLHKHQGGKGFSTKSFCNEILILSSITHPNLKSEMTLADMVVPKIQMGALHQVLDPVLVVDGEAKEGVGAVAELAFRCVAADKDDRPDAREVAAELRRIRSRARGSGVLRTSNSSNAVVPDGSGLIID